MHGPTGEAPHIHRLSLLAPTHIYKNHKPKATPLGGIHSTDQRYLYSSRSRVQVGRRARSLLYIITLPVNVNTHSPPSRTNVTQQHSTLLTAFYLQHVEHVCSFTRVSATSGEFQPHRRFPLLGWLPPSLKAATTPFCRRISSFASALRDGRSQRASTRPSPAELVLSGVLLRLHSFSTFCESAAL